MGDQKLQEEVARIAKEGECETKRCFTHLQSLLEAMEAKFQEDVLRSSEDHDLKRERGIAAVQGACDSALSSMDAAVREEMGRLKAHGDRSVENASNKHRSVVEALERKLTEAMARMSAEEEKKHDEHRQSLKMSNGELLTMLQNDIGQCTESVDVKLNELRMSSSVELSALREDVARAVTDMDGKCERGLDHTTSSFEALERKLDLESAARSEENSTERDVRSREVADLCGAVKSMQAWLTDVESMGTQRNEARTREFENVTARLSELKEHQFTLRSELIKHQEHIDHFKGFQVDKVTEELRKVVQDLALTSDHQGDKIKELESTLDGAREAKSEVHRLKGDLDAEVSTRALKDNELQGRLERELQEFSRRVERLTAATSELGGDLQKSRSAAMLSPMRSPSISPSSIGAVPVGAEHNTRLGSISSRHQTRMSSFTGSLYGVDP